MGREYEPYIFAALNSAKVMLCVGTDYEYFNAVWVRNEWSRFLKMMEKDKAKHLIPCYKGIDAYDIPKEFNKLQAQDLGKVGAIQDLLRGIDKLIQPTTGETTTRASVGAEDLNNSFIYNNALEIGTSKKPKEVKKAIKKLETIRGFWDTDKKIEELKKRRKKLIMKRWLLVLLIVGVILGGINAFFYYLKLSDYQAAIKYGTEYEYGKAMYLLGTLDGFKDSEEQIEALQQLSEERDRKVVDLVNGTVGDGDSS